jgi:membrane protease YdiL (CAAX protease family)
MISNWLIRRPLLSYILLVFGISWSGILIVFRATGFMLTVQPPVATGLFFVMMLLGPSLGGLTFTVLLDGRAGLRDLRARLMRWNVSASWYAVALLTAPTLLLAILLLLSIFVAPAFAPRFQWALLPVGLLAASFEEIGWTGYATPLLLARRGVGTAGLLLGLVWALWHALVAFLFTYSAMGQSWLLSFTLVYLATLTPYRILMTWVYANTQSALLAILMHASFTSWLLVIFPDTSQIQSLAWQSAFATALWIAAAVVLQTSHDQG